VVSPDEMHRHIATAIVDAFLEEIYEALRRGHSVSLRGFGSFSVRPERETRIFRFNPSQRLRALLGWSSTDRGPR
jgi:nucleoid DNA-binding protein